MLTPLNLRVDEPELRRLLLKHFPELSPEIDEFDGLVHLEMCALEGLANKFIKAGDLKALSKVYEFVGDLARHQSELHPDVINAIHVSFLEGLHFENERFGESAKISLPAVLRKMWEAQMEHNRMIFTNKN